MKLKGSLAVLLAVFPGSSAHSLSYKDYPILTERRMELTKDFLRERYGIDSCRLSDPRMIVIHFTAASLKTSLEIFKPEVLSGRSSRTPISWPSS